MTSLQECCNPKDVSLKFQRFSQWRKVSQSNSLRCSASLREIKKRFNKFGRSCSWLAARCSSPPCVRDWSGILLKRSGKRYSGKPDGGAGSEAGTPKERRLHDYKLLGWCGFQQKKHFVNIRAISWMEDLRSSGFRVQSSKFFWGSEILNFLYLK